MIRLQNCFMNCITCMFPHAQITLTMATTPSIENLTDIIVAVDCEEGLPAYVDLIKTYLQRGLNPRNFLLNRNQQEPYIATIKLNEHDTAFLEYISPTENTSTQVG